VEEKKKRGREGEGGDILGRGVKGGKDERGGDIRKEGGKREIDIKRGQFTKVNAKKKMGKSGCEEKNEKETGRVSRKQSKKSKGM